MTNIYEFQIATLKQPVMVVGEVTLRDVIVSVTEIRCIASNGDFRDTSAFICPAEPLALEPPNPATFTPADQLTREQVEGWVLPMISEGDMDDLKARADAALAAQIAAAAPDPQVPVAGPVFGPAEPAPLAPPQPEEIEGQDGGEATEE